MEQLINKKPWFAENEAPDWQNAITNIIQLIAWVLAIVKYAQQEITRGEKINVDYLMKLHHAGWSLSNDWGEYGYDPDVGGG